MLKEARIIVPVACGDAVLAHVRVRCVRSCGGYTEYAGSGGWVNDDGGLVEEPVRIFDFAMDDGLLFPHWVGELAREVCVMGNQTCVYVRLPSGEVHLVRADGEA